jgi:hypothetical protein
LPSPSSSPHAASASAAADYSRQQRAGKQERLKKERADRKKQARKEYRRRAERAAFQAARKAKRAAAALLGLDEARLSPQFPQRRTTSPNFLPFALAPFTHTGSYQHRVVPISPAVRQQHPQTNTAELDESPVSSTIQLPRVGHTG